MKHALPPLAARTTRVRLLAATYEDALTACAAAGRADDHGARMNLHDELWTYGSYRELERNATTAPAAFRRYYLGVQFKDQPASDLDELRHVTDRMPRDIFVPVLVALNAGYLEGEAGTYRMPDRERLRRWARV